jgi:hypothetical protein
MHGPSYGPGLHSSIIETVAAVFQDGQPNSVKVTGEVALSYVPDPDAPFAGEPLLSVAITQLLDQTDKS